ncbi:MAG: LysR family transcriptional regulator [Pseudomonadota bacterium]
MNIDAKHLSAVEIIRREGGLTRAASVLRTSQPAPSRMISDLEIRLDAPIFDRSSRPWALTALGASLATQGASVIRAQQQAARDLEQFKFGTGAAIRMIGPQFLTDGVIARLLPAFRDRHPGVSFEIDSGYADKLIDAVRFGPADIAFYPRGVGEIEDDLHFTPLASVRNVIACRAGHPLLQLTRPRPLALLDYGWIVPPMGSPLRADMELVLSDLEMQDADIVFAGGSLASVLSFLAGTDCLTVLPKWTVASMGALFDIQIVEIDAVTPRRLLGILSRRRRELSNTTNAFIDYITAQLGDR